jgi:hypothetical protein
VLAAARQAAGLTGPAAFVAVVTWAAPAPTVASALNVAKPADRISVAHRNNPMVRKCICGGRGEWPPEGGHNRHLAAFRV